MKKEYLGHLTGVRIFLTLTVVLSNMALYPDVDPGLLHQSHWKIMDILATAPIRVDIFFMLTGFLLFHIYHERFIKIPTGGKYFNFLIRRIARVYPVHIFVIFFIALFIIFGIWQTDNYGSLRRLEHPINWFYNIFMMHAWGLGDHMSSFNGPSWSISVELINYFIFPLLAFLFLKLTKLWHYISVFLIVLLLYEYIQIAHIKNIGVYYGPGAILRGVVGMVLGMCIAQIYLSGKLRRFQWDYIFIAVVIFIGIIMAYSLKMDKSFHYFFYLPLPFFILSLAFSKGIVKRFLSLPFMIYLGNLSFAVYMIHQPFLRVAEYFFEDYYHNLVIQKDNWNILLQLSFLLIAMILTAHLIYKYVETPARNWVKRKYP